MMVRRASVSLTLLVLLALVVSGCITTRSVDDMDATIVARVVVTLQSAETPAPGKPTATSAPDPTAIAEPTMTPPAEIGSEEYAVYSAMILQNPIGYSLGSYILIREQTVTALDELESSLENGASLPARMIESFRSLNEALYAIHPNLEVELDYGLMPEEEFESIFRSGGSGASSSRWVRFQEEYPQAGGVVAFSRVGFNAAEDKALVLMGYRCGDLCGAGGLYLLSKDEGNWKVKEPLMEWQS